MPEIIFWINSCPLSAILYLLSYICCPLSYIYYPVLVKFKAGEELTVSYMNLFSQDPDWQSRCINDFQTNSSQLEFWWNWKQQKRNRQSYLLKHFGFSCTCRLCSLEGVDREKVTWTTIVLSSTSIVTIVYIAAVFYHHFTKTRMISLPFHTFWWQPGWWGEKGGVRHSGSTKGERRN